VDPGDAMKLSVFCGVSLDGFLARPDDALDFPGTGEQEPYGFEEFYASVDVVVIGRKTFEVVLTFGKWFYGKKPVVVLSSRPLDVCSVKDGVVGQMSGKPIEIVTSLKARGFKHAYLDGGITIQRFLAAGLIDRLVITRVPVLIGAGIPLFGPLPGDINLRHVATRSYKGGLVQSEYEIGAEAQIEYETGAEAQIKVNEHSSWTPTGKLKSNAGQCLDENKLSSRSNAAGRAMAAQA
jgi:dihydrofolate reductase